MPDPGNNIGRPVDLSEISNKDWALAEKRKRAIEKLLSLRNPTKSDVSTQAAELGCSVAWLYRLMQRYKEEGTVTALLPKDRSGGRGKSRIDPQLDLLVRDVIEEHYLTRQKLKPIHIVREIRLRCHKLNLRPPSENTIRARIKAIPERQKVAARVGGKEARNTFEPAPGQFPPPKWPLSVVQMDHTPTDIIIVDEKYREPIGRAYLTIAVDVYSRAILGMHVSLEAPSAASVGLCLTHSVFPKTEWLKQRKIETEWPIWGKMDVLHVDNGSDFRSEALKRGCSEHGIQLEYRPIKDPRYGGTVERLFKTLNNDIHSWDGTTFSNVNERGTYQSEKSACLTLAELERLLTIMITKKYHETPHSAIMMSPRRAFEKGIFGDDHDLGRGMPQSPGDTRQFLIDFLPVSKRTIQREGIVWDYVHYFDDVLRPFIDRNDTRKFIVRRDPRDISRVFLFCPDSRTYLEIPYRNISNPSISIWELKAARKRLKKQAFDHKNEAAIFRAHEEIQETLALARSTTKRTRRVQEQRRRNKSYSDKTVTAAPQKRNKQIGTPPEDPDLTVTDKFDDIEHW